MSLAATTHMQDAIVVARDDAGTEFAIRGLHGGPVIDLTLQEAHWVQQIRLQGVPVVLQGQFGSLTVASDLQKLVALILRLHQTGLLGKIADPELMKSVESLAHQTNSAGVGSHSRQKKAPQRLLARTLRIPELIGSNWFPAGTGVLLGGLFLLSSKSAAFSVATALALLDSPAATLLRLWFAVLAASTIHSLIVGWITWAASPEAIKEEPRLTITLRAWLFLIAENQHHPLDMLSRRTRSGSVWLP